MDAGGVSLWWDSAGLVIASGSMTPAVVGRRFGWVLIFVIAGCQSSGAGSRVKADARNDGGAVLDGNSGGGGHTSGGGGQSSGGRGGQASGGGGQSSGGSGGQTSGGGGQSTGSGGAGGSAPTCASIAGVFSWDENGVHKCAVQVTALRIISDTDNELLMIALSGDQIGGPAAGGYVIDIDTFTAPPPSGTYPCSMDLDAGAVYVNGDIPPVLQSKACTITVDDAGTPGTSNARGSFSGTYKRLDDSIIEITNGKFDVPVTGQSHL
jgi:hypothetical protein